MRTFTFTCASCDATIVDSPVFHIGLAFCCAGCAADGPCMCSYDGPGAEAATAIGSMVAAGGTARREAFAHFGGGDPGEDLARASLPTAIVEPPALAAPTISTGSAEPPAPTPARPADPARTRARVDGVAARRA